MSAPQEVVYTDPALRRYLSGYNFVKSYFAFMFGLLGLAMFGLLGYFLASTTFGFGSVYAIMIGLGVFIAIPILIVFYYMLGVVKPAATATVNLSAQVFETPELGYGAWIITGRPPDEIPFPSDDARLMPVRIPMTTGARTATNGGNPSTIQPDDPEQTAVLEEPGLEIIQEAVARCPSDKCSYHHTDFPVEIGRIQMQLPFLQFRTYAYIFTPGEDPIRQAVLIFPCPYDHLRRVQELIFYKGFPVTAPTTFVSLSRVFEMDEHVPIYSAPAFVVNFSSWHVEIAQQLAGFVPAYMVPNQERIISIYNLWGIREAQRLQQQNATLQARITALEENLGDFSGQVMKTSWNVIKSYLRTRELPGVGSRLRWLRPRTILLIIALIAITASIVYLITRFAFPTSLPVP